MSVTTKPTDDGSAHHEESTTPTVRSVEAARWTSLQGRMTATERRRALRLVAEKMG